MPIILIHFRKYKVIYTHLILFMALLFGLSSCASIGYVKIENAISDNRSILIFPLSESNIEWQIIDNSSKPFTFSTFKAGDVSVTSVKPGVYYIKSVTFKDTKKRNLRYEETYNSSIGNIEIDKTPEKERISFERERKGKFSTWIEKGEEVNSITSYYIMKYTFDKDKPIIGTITVMPNEVILMPLVEINFIMRINACQYRGDSGSFLDLFTIAEIIKSDDRFDDFNHLYWSCPAEQMYITTKTISIETLLSKVDKKYFPDGVLDRVIFRDFEFGNISKNIEKEEELNGIKTIKYKVETFE
ncbi:MAG: hypothetical protein LBL65_05030 [Campylobacteraceae bacterium]|nr:hypothetical protein [Campylobacteraceae bacterium]